MAAEDEKKENVLKEESEETLLKKDKDVEETVFTLESIFFYKVLSNDRD